ncbi:hypothetical protein H2200_000602 [Cladophialophora chaetospira]|uniref:C2H2-type domain-containing protein n=1 Tax=Cladophialophora chaetospira TaxID=386627 RepID=A0AA38XNV1_9EURO|nr:hypothetical protein H2200_000602 [Cladophialophora chaetospira]
MNSKQAPVPQELWHAQLFSYLPRYRVIVCNTCRYAVPPKAVSRHLKEIHRILRSARQPFLDWVSTLALCEPEEVIVPNREEFPVPELPVYTGLRCRRRDCGHLCLTEKRMKSHWLSAHPKENCEWSSVPVQTFFRGNLLKYFSAPSRLSEGKVDEDGSLVWRFLDINWAWQKGASPPPDALKSGRILASPIASSRNFGLDSMLVGLIHHYQTSTSQTIALNGNNKLFWSNTVLQIAQGQSFLMLGVLSIAALHLAYLLPRQRREWTIRANEYHGQAMPLFRHATAYPTAENCHAILLFSHLLILNTFTSDQQDDNLLLVTRNGDDTVPSWLYFIRNSCSMLCSVWDDVEAGPCNDLALEWEAPFNVNERREKMISSELLTAAPARNSTLAWSEDVYEVYQAAASELAFALACLDSGHHDSFSTWDALRVWPMRLSDDFVRLLKQKHPAALILLAHYSTILRRIDSKWYLQGRAEALLRTIRRELDPHWHVALPQLG